MNSSCCSQISGGWEYGEFESMESGQSLTRVISEMQNEIRKLESENKELRGQLDRPDSCALSSSPQESLFHANLRRNVSAPDLEGQYKGTQTLVSNLGFMKGKRASWLLT